MLVPGESNISYICSRFYRAPELIFGATDYTTAIDVWSVGCVMAELLLGQPVFPGQPTSPYRLLLRVQLLIQKGRVTILDLILLTVKTAHLIQLFVSFLKQIESWRKYWDMREGEHTDVSHQTLFAA